MTKSVVAILAGHHGRGTGASSFGRDEWDLVRHDAGELFVALQRDGIVQPILEPLQDDDDVHERSPITRAARWCLSHKAAAVIELHYNSFTDQTVSGHLVCSNRMTPFVECMANALDVLPNKRRDTIINANFLLPKLVDPIPCVLLEPAFIFEPCVALPEWRPMLIAAVKQGLYTYFAGGE